MDERRARRKELQEKYGKKTTPTPQTQATSFGSLNDPPPTPSAPRFQSTSLEDLTGGDQLLRSAENVEDIEAEAGLGPQAEDPDMRLDPEEERRQRQENTEAYRTETGRLELPPMDQNRPVLGASGYQAPSKATHIIVLAFFGIAMFFVYRAVPSLKSTLFPFSNTDIKFDDNLMPIATDNNSLRNASNIQQLDTLAQWATFLVAWGVVIIYVGLLFMLLVGFIRSILWNRLAKQQYEATKDLDHTSTNLYQ